MKTINDIVCQIAAFQKKAGDKYIPEGCFESFRSNKWLFYKRPDANLFSTAITIFTLNQLKNKCDAVTKALIERMTMQAQSCYHLYQSKEGHDTYNFFQTKPSRYFANGYLLKHLSFLQLPDDIDDTAMVFLTTNPTENQLEKLQTRLKNHSNLVQKTIVNTFSDYRYLQAYNTWFGKKMYNEFDACAISNILYCISFYKMEFDLHAKSSLYYLKSVVLSDQYINNPFNVAHHYASTPVIMYHLARLFSSFELEDMDKTKRKLSHDIDVFLKNPTIKGMDRLILESSYIRLNPSNHFFINDQVFELYDANWSFFLGGFLTAYENKCLYKMASHPIFHLKWICQAHSLALLAERISLGED